MKKRDDDGEVLGTALLDDVVASAAEEAKEKDDAEQEGIYEIDPRVCAEDIVINTEDSPKLMFRPGRSSIRLLRGDRVKGKYFLRMVTREHVTGLQQCCKLPRKMLEDLEKERQLRLGILPPEWVKDVQKNKRTENE